VLLGRRRRPAISRDARRHVQKGILLYLPLQRHNIIINTDWKYSEDIGHGEMQEEFARKGDNVVFTTPNTLTHQLRRRKRRYATRKDARRTKKVLVWSYAAVLHEVVGI